jgi:hypothetical protein
MGRVYRTAQGRELDIEKIRLQHEEVPALGNMRVNARGDQLGPGGRILRTREQIMDEHYKAKPSATQNRPVDGPIPTRNRRADDPIPTSSRRAQEFTPGDLTADPAPAAPPSEQETAEAQTGLKGGLARAVKRAQDGTEKKGLRRL